jgi:hypothetical protein
LRAGDAVLVLVLVAPSIVDEAREDPVDKETALLFEKLESRERYHQGGC